MQKKRRPRQYSRAADIVVVCGIVAMELLVLILPLPKLAKLAVAVASLVCGLVLIWQDRKRQYGP